MPIARMEIVLCQLLHIFSMKMNDFFDRTHSGIRFGCVLGDVEHFNRNRPVPAFAHIFKEKQRLFNVVSSSRCVLGDDENFIEIVLCQLLHIFPMKMDDLFDRTHSGIRLGCVLGDDENFNRNRPVQAFAHMFNEKQ